MKRLLILLTGIILFSCTKENKTQKIGKDFLEIYSHRKELDKMLSFYSDKFEYRNMSFESETKDPKFLYEQFYGWADPAFKFESAESVKIEQLITDDSTIVVKGKSMPYVYNGKHIEGNDFIIWLNLDKNHKIKKQTDWFNYPMNEIIEAWQLKNSFKIE